MAGDSKRNKQRSLWWQIFCSDPWRKIVALILGFFCWWSIKESDESAKHWFSNDHVPIDITNLENSDGPIYLFDDKGARIKNEELTVTLRLSSGDTLSNQPNPDNKDFRIVLRPELFRKPAADPENRNKPLELEYVLSEDDVIVKPAGVTIRSFAPATLKLKWDYQSTRLRPVKIDIDASHFKDKTIIPRPEKEQVQIIGPAHKLNDILEVRNDSHILSQEELSRQEFEAQMSLHESLVDLDAKDQRITCELVVTNKHEIITKKLEGVRVKFLDRADTRQMLDQSSVTVEAVTITLMGQRKELESLDANNIIAFCDISQYTVPGVMEVPVQVTRQPRGVEVVEITPKQIRVRLVNHQSTVPQIPTGH